MARRAARRSRSTRKRSNRSTSAKRGNARRRAKAAVHRALLTAQRKEREVRRKIPGALIADDIRHSINRLRRMERAVSKASTLKALRGFERSAKSTGRGVARVARRTPALGVGQRKVFNVEEYKRLLDPDRDALGFVRVGYDEKFATSGHDVLAVCDGHPNIAQITGIDRFKVRGPKPRPFRRKDIPAKDRREIVRIAKKWEARTGGSWRAHARRITDVYVEAEDGGCFFEIETEYGESDAA